MLSQIASRFHLSGVILGGTGDPQYLWPLPLDQSITQTVGGPGQTALKRARVLARTFVAFLNIALDLCLIPRHGALGAAIANCSAQIAGVLGGTFYVTRFAQARFPWSSTLKIYFSATTAVAPAAYCFFWAEPGIAMRVASVAVGAMLYFGLLLVTGELGKDEFNVLKGAFFKKVYSPKRQEASDLA